MVLSSAYRCQVHNAAVGGKSDSAHLTGHAADILCHNNHDRYDLLTVALKLFTRIGIHGSFIHVDTDNKKPQGVVWLY